MKKWEDARKGKGEGKRSENGREPETGNHGEENHTEMIDQMLENMIYMDMDPALVLAMQTQNNMFNNAIRLERQEQARKMVWPNFSTEKKEQEIIEEAIKYRKCRVMKY